MRGPGGRGERAGARLIPVDPADPARAQVALTVKALQRFRLGTDMSLFATEQLSAGASQAYPGYPVGSGVEGTETYQSPPFTETLDTSPKGYQVPAY